MSAEMLNYEFDTKNLVSLVVSSAVGVWYLLKKVGVCGGVGTLYPPLLRSAASIIDAHGL